MRLSVVESEESFTSSRTSYTDTEKCPPPPTVSDLTDPRDCAKSDDSYREGLVGSVESGGASTDSVPARPHSYRRPRRVTPPSFGG